jgi:hypothetical protein
MTDIEEQKQGAISKFISGTFGLIFGFITGKNTIRAVCYGIIPVYTVFATSMSNLDTANGMYWLASIAIVSLIMVNLGDVLNNLMGNNVNVVKVVQDAIDEKLKSTSTGTTVVNVTPAFPVWQGVSYSVNSNGFTVATIDVPVWRANGGKCIKDFKTSPLYLPIIGKNGANVWSEEQGFYEASANVIHGITDDIFADELPLAP